MIQRFPDSECSVSLASFPISCSESHHVDQSHPLTHQLASAVSAQVRDHLSRSELDTLSDLTNACGFQWCRHKTTCEYACRAVVEQLLTGILPRSSNEAPWQHSIHSYFPTQALLEMLMWVKLCIRRSPFSFHTHVWISVVIKDWYEVNSSSLGRTTEISDHFLPYWIVMGLSWLPRNPGTARLWILPWGGVSLNVENFLNLRRLFKHYWVL